jgi:DNA-damage-inducible protein J
MKTGGMMAKTAVVKARIEPELKDEVENILYELGLSPTEAVTLFYRQVKLRKGLPFMVAIPNDVTLRTFEDTDGGRNLTRYRNKEELFADLEI